MSRNVGKFIFWGNFGRLCVPGLDSAAESESRGGKEEE